MSKGLYIHIPFCKYICSYCDFGKKYITKQPVDEYVNSLINEMDLYTFTEVDTIYIGGGTPSSLNFLQTEKLLRAINSRVDISKVVEFSFELNPDDITVEYLQLLKRYNVNRLSIGIQTLNDNILQAINRMHTKAQAISGVDLALLKFDNVSVDFMFNLPMQTKADIDESLQFISERKLAHVSYYGLIMEGNTILATEKHRYWDEDEEAKMYSYIQTQLQKLGYNNYEISNYAQANYQSAHNIHYWQADNYYGIGLSASGYLEDIRYTNTASIKDYIKRVSGGKKPIASNEKINDSDRLFERIMLGLRYAQNVYLPAHLIAKIKKSEYLQDKLVIGENFIRLDAKYYYISNQIIIEVLELS